MMKADTAHDVIVGGTHGGGRAWLKQLCSRGRSVTVLGRRPPLAQDRGCPGVEHIVVDLADAKAVSRCCERLARRGPINSLVFFQRYRGPGDAWQGELAVSLTATRLLIEELRDRFAKDGARSIVVVGSVAVDLVAQEQPVSYHVAKAGLRQLVRYYAASLGQKGLRVNMVSPAVAIKEESAKFYARQKTLLALYRRIIPLGRMGSFEEIAGVIDFLCSPAAAYITGQDLRVDGGLSLMWQETLARTLAGPAKPITRRT